MSQIFQSVGTSEGGECSICHQVIQGLKIKYSCDDKTASLCEICNESLVAGLNILNSWSISLSMQRSENMTKPEDWIPVRIKESGTIITSDGRATDDAGKTFRTATEEEMKWFLEE